MSYTLEETTVEHMGLTFKVTVEQDTDTGRPWQEHDGHGPVREGHRSDYYRGIEKTPGERVLFAGDRNQYTWLYDWAGAVKLAEKDGWGVSEDRRPANWETLTKGQQRELAVQSDFDFLKAWCDEEWVWAGVVVTLMVEGKGGDLVEYDGPLAGTFHDSLWATEYWQYEGLKGAKNSHIKEVIDELIGGVAKAYLKEAAEKLACEERDIVTEAA